MVTFASRAWLGVSAVLALLVWSSVVGAEDDAAVAQQLFRQGREASAQGDYVTACAKFEQSLQLFRRASTLLNLGVCHQQLGRTATALAFWEQGAALLDPGDERMEQAKEEVAALRARAPIVQVILPAILPAGAVITLDGKAVGRSLLDREQRLDPGSHELWLLAPGYAPRQVQLQAKDGATERVELNLGPALAPPPTSPLPRAAEYPMPRQQGPSPHVVPTWVWPVGGAGILVAAVAVPFAVDYANTLSTQEELCGGDIEQCDPVPTGSYDPADDNSRKYRDAVLTTAFAGAGGLALAAAVVGAVVGSDPPVADVALSVGADHAFARLELSF